MNIADMINNTADQIFEPETGALPFVRDFASYQLHLQEAENDYAEAVKTFESTDPGSRYIFDIVNRANEAGYVLIRRALAVYRMSGTTLDDKKYANEIVDRVTKDSSIRELTCSQYYRFMKEANPTAHELIAAILKEKQKVMSFLDRCINTQSYYLKKIEKSQDYVDPIRKGETEAAIQGERERACVPEGSRFCPAIPFPPERIPWDQPVPQLPDPYQRYQNVDPEDKVFNVEHSNFELREDYLSEDGLIDGDSVKFDYENHKVTMKYRGGTPVIWNFRQFIDTKDVPKPGEWFSEYLIRAYQQSIADISPGVLEHRDSDREVPEYNRIPVGSEQQSADSRY